MMDNQQIDTLELLIEKVGKKMRYYHNFRAKLAKLEAVVEAAQEIEYIDIGEAFEFQELDSYVYPPRFCPSCGYKKPDGHRKDCKLGKALKEALKEWKG
jgi:hypothetical protein